MRHAYMRLAGLLIALMLVMTGCNLIKIDPVMQLDEDIAALKKQYSGVIATYDGGEITQEQVMATFNSEYSYMSQLYSMYGMSMTSDVVTDIEQYVAEEAVKNVAIAKQIEARGLSLDADKQAEVEAEAEEHYKEAYDNFYANATGETEEERAKRAEYSVCLSGYTQEALYEMELAEANQELIEQTVRDEIAELTDDQLQAAYDQKVSEDEEEYSASAYAFENAMSSESSVVCWMPEGYRTVKHILVKPEDDVMSALTSARSAVSSAESELEDLREELEALSEESEDAEDAAEAEDAGEDEDDWEDEEDVGALRSAEEIQADIDAAEANLETLKADAEKAEADCLAAVKEKTDEIYAKIEAGEDFEALIEAYGEDPGMKNEPTKTRGYYVSSGSVSWDANFTAGAMSLEKVGDVTMTPVVSSSGVHIIRYESDVTAGAVPLEDVKDALYEETIDDMRTDHYNEELDKWVEALNPKYTIGNFNLSTNS